MINSFQSRLLAVGLLDRYALAGAIAGWWQDARNELKALSVQGFAGVVDGWVETVETMLSPDRDPRTGGARKRSTAERRQAYGHKVVAAIARDFLDDLAEADRVKAELDAKWKAAEEAKAVVDAAAAGAGADEDGESEPPDPALATALLSPEETAKLAKDRKAAGKRIKDLEDDFWPLSGVRPAEPDTAPARAGNVQTSLLDAAEDARKPRLLRARDALSADEKQKVVLDIMRADLTEKLNGHVLRRRQMLLERYATWIDKYGVSLREIETERTAAAKRVNNFLGELGLA